MAFTIRAASPTDLPSITTLDIAAHKPASAFLNLNLLSPDDMNALWLSRYAHFLSQPDRYRFLVAITSKNESTDDGNIAGFLVGARPNLEGFKEDKWNPVFPEDAPVEKLAWISGLLKSLKEDKMKYLKNDMWELEALATSPSYQRRGVGSLLLTHWLQEVDIAHGTLYVRASRSGRGLYEKLGCVSKGEHSVDVGWTQPIVNSNMIRAAKGM